MTWVRRNGDAERIEAPVWHSCAAQTKENAWASNAHLHWTGLKRKHKQQALHTQNGRRHKSPPENEPPNESLKAVRRTVGIGVVGRRRTYADKASQRLHAGKGIGDGSSMSTDAFPDGTQRQALPKCQPITANHPYPAIHSQWNQS